MYQIPFFATSTIVAEREEVGESIEQKIERIINNNEPISDGAPEIFQRRNEGVDPSFNPRTDKFDLALDVKAEEYANKVKAREFKLEKLQGGKADNGDSVEPKNGTTGESNSEN